ncbi:DUF3152 domain-containing protein [Streptomyces sp. NPDC056661]|uniref:DUF3152 domain-containing protein n=1 Tax=Streptomyces sp. NPDC056661 TaxID=3345898 RepID=UPI00367D1BFD
MVNSTRWNTGASCSTALRSCARRLTPVHRPSGRLPALIINHQVGHRIGHGHAGCPDTRRPAPVRMQQIKGLNSCLPNAGLTPPTAPNSADHPCP